MKNQKQTASNIALLTPVPLEHLISGRMVGEKEGKVAFGSRAWELFRQLDHERKGMPVDVYIYASLSEDPRAIVSWRGRYIGQVDSIAGAHPAGIQFRPPSTANDSPDFAIFWEVEDLSPLPGHDCLGLASFTGFSKNRGYGRDFVPEGPLLIEHP